ncbi:MAG: hypothetical protein QMD08_07990 [Actinomycetota bacterium]|nr:hypothetical protein [Actinomycetota bacterium]
MQKTKIVISLSLGEKEEIVGALSQKMDYFLQAWEKAKQGKGYNEELESKFRDIHAEMVNLHTSITGKFNRGIRGYPGGRRKNGAPPST